jgi:tetratricopeptide (TPR) repeat protein
MQEAERLVEFAALAEEAARRADRADLETDALALRSIGYATVGDARNAMEWLARALATGRGRHSKAVVQSTMILYHAGKLEDAVAVTRDLVTTAKSARDATTLVLVLANHGLALAGSGRYADALAAFAEAQDLGLRTGAMALVARATSMAAGFFLDLDDFDAAEVIARRALDMAVATGFAFPRTSASIDLLFMAARRRDLAACDDLYRAVEATIPSWRGSHAWLWRQRLPVALAEVELVKGNHAGVLAAANEALTVTERYQRKKYQVLALAVRSRAHLASRDPSSARVDARRAEAIARELGDPAIQLRVARTLLEIEPSDPAVLAAADALTTRIQSALPDASTRASFLARLQEELAHS